VVQSTRMSLDRLTCKAPYALIFRFRSAIDGLDKKQGGGAAANHEKKSLNNAGNTSMNENESFNKHYNKELKVSEGKVAFLYLP